MSINLRTAVWFLAVRTGTGTDVFTERLSAGLNARGVRNEITWLPLRAEYLPWTVPVPAPPEWATVVHINTWLHPRFLPRHLPIVATLHHSIHHPDFTPYKGLPRMLYHRYWIRSVERRTLQRANAAIAVSQFAAKTARQTLLDRPIHVIYNGVDTERFRPPRQPVQNLPFRLLFVGSWLKRKGVDLLAPIMRELGGGFELRYTGGAAAKHDRQSMPPNMHDIGRLNGEGAVITAMQAVDAFLFPSRSEGLPQVVIEAMACGLPVIAAQTPALAEVVEDRITGVLCGQEDVSAYANSAQGLAADITRMRAMRDAARVRAIERFSIVGMLDRYLVAYDEAVDDGLCS